MTIDLDEQSWRTVLALLAKAPWEQANGLIMAIGGQMQQQQGQAAANPPQPQRARGNSGSEPNLAQQ
jgi:hypothetical protein